MRNRFRPAVLLFAAVLFAGSIYVPVHGGTSGGSPGCPTCAY